MTTLYSSVIYARKGGEEEEEEKEETKEKERKQGKSASAAQESFFNSSLFACSNPWCFKNQPLLLGRDKVTVLRLVGIGGRCAVCCEISGASFQAPLVEE